MPQARRSRQAKRSGASSGARKGTAGAKASGRGKPGARREKAAPRRPAGEQAASRGATAMAADAVDISAKTVADLRQALSSRLIDPLELVMLTRERIEEVLADAVTRGRVTAEDAQDLVSGLLVRGRRQTNDVLGDLEGLLGRARNEGGEQADPVDQARGTGGLGPSFPISGYDDLTAAQVQARLTDLSPAELRRVRDYERRHANRKTVLSAAEKALA